MSADHIEIRRLAQEDAADAVLYRDIRLKALQANPEAFGSTFEVENALPLSLFSDRLGSSTVLGAFRDTELVGIACFVVQQGQKEAHKGTLWGMYVRPTARNVRSVDGWSKRYAITPVNRLSSIQLSVVLDNEPARVSTREWASWSTAWRRTLSSKLAATTTRFLWPRISCGNQTRIRLLTISPMSEMGHQRKSAGV